jgi:hypothetical protein
MRFRQLLIFNLLDVRQFPCLVEQRFFRAVKAEENFANFPSALVETQFDLPGLALNLLRTCKESRRCDTLVARPLRKSLWVGYARTQPDLWAGVVAALAQGENLLPEPELPLIHLDSPYNREGQLPRPASPPAFPPAVSHSR